MTVHTDPNRQALRSFREAFLRQQTKRVNALEYYAHVCRKGSGEITAYQTVAEHLTETSRLCRTFAEAFGSGADGALAGSLHDLGKCTKGFQDRLLYDDKKVDHATAGAILCAKQGHLFTAACVAGHHGGLPDFGNLRTDRLCDTTLFGRLKKGNIEQALERCEESGLAPSFAFSSAAPTQNKLRASFWTRMLYSCLVDADFLDTERFMQGEQGRDGAESLNILLSKLIEYVAPWQDPKSDLNRLRCEILNTCLNSGHKAKGLYLLTVPTGGGKTVASLAFALRHAVEHGMKRVIYVIPYTSIIDQNAEVFRGILGDGNVLAHHSGVQFERSDGASPEEIRKSLAVENWDMPVVVTTAVQFFESMYANRSSRCRKLHNLANSVIIFDEAQMLPLAQLRPCVAAMASLVSQFHSTVVLCTATQPSLNDLFLTYAPKYPAMELCPLTAAQYRKFRRVTFCQAGVLEDEALAEQIKAHPQVLCIVNSRRAAQRIFSLLPEGSYHLSTLMIPAQRQLLLAEIRERLAKGLPCRVVSTSLIEAGVDVDFPAVYREMAGLDSILQAAGRCNREGRHPVAESVVTIFERTELPPLLFRQAVGASREALGANCDPGAPETMSRYFRSLRSLTGDALDKQGIVKAFEQGLDGCDFPFRTVAEKFRFIDRNTYTVYVPYQETGAELVGQLQAGVCSKDLYRKLGRYAVSVYDRHFQALYAAGALLTAKEIPTLDADSAILADMTLYSETMGLSLEPETGKAEFI